MGPNGGFFEGDALAGVGKVVGVGNLLLVTSQ